MSERLARPRPISIKEIAVLKTALSVAAVVPSASALISSVTELTVLAHCSCGCDSVEFAPLPPEAPRHIAADAVAKAPDGDPIGLIVWAAGGHVSQLEVYNFSERLARLPVVSSIQSYWAAGSRPIA